MLRIYYRKVITPKMLLRSRVAVAAGLFIATVTLAGILSHSAGVLQTASNVLPLTSPIPLMVAHSPVITSAKFAPNYAIDLLNLRRWQKNNLVIYVAQPNAVDNPEGRDFVTAIHEGSSLWNPYLGNPLTVTFTEKESEADIRISFVDKGTLPEGAIGRTEVTYRNRDNVIVAATVRIDRTLRTNLLTQVAAHEIGHAFGMEGHSVEKTDLMYARAHLPAAITERDANTLHLNYSLDAPRSDAKPTAQIDPTHVTQYTPRYTTRAACSLP